MLGNQLQNQISVNLTQADVDARALSDGPWETPTITMEQWQCP